MHGLLTLHTVRLSPVSLPEWSHMAELVPHPFDSLVSRMFRELEAERAIFDLPERKFVTSSGDVDTSVSFHHHRASSPLGPAAGPHTQMAQNIVLSWLGGCRIFELKTVQVKDDLAIPRPCIDMRNIGYNAEWSQELKVEDSLEEYVKAAMLIEMLRQSGKVNLTSGFCDLVYDMSVGYDLAGIQSDKVSRFLDGMLDASAVVTKLRGQIPREFAHLRDLEFPTRISDTLTLSTFHGCPPDEIERIIDYLMRRWNLHCIVKFNPMLLGADEARHLLHDVMGYDDIRIPDSAFERDATWPKAVEIVERLSTTAMSLGLGFGVKFSNTLIVENRAGFLPESEKEVYLSGAPLHVLAINLVRRFRRQFADRIPISFSAGIDWNNYPDAVALGLVPITVCSDLLKTGGYGRLATYHAKLVSTMQNVDARSIDDYMVKAYGLGLQTLEAAGIELGTPKYEACASALEENGDLRQTAGDDLWRTWVRQAKLINTEHYTGRVTQDPRYAQAANSTLPPRIDSHLELFDCITCDKCIPVCPNDANFTFVTGPARIPVLRLREKSGKPVFERNNDLVLEKERQIATFADFCNECGNCDVFCPEEGGPYQFKPLFFGSEDGWRRWKDHDGFHLARMDGHDIVLGRFHGADYRLDVEGRAATFSGESFNLSLDLDRPEETIEGQWENEVDLTWCFIMDLLRRSVLDGEGVNWMKGT